MDDFYDLGTNSAFDRMFRKPKLPEFINVDLNINPTQFIEWLKVEDRDISGNYENDIAGECEHSCLYILMLLGGEGLSVQSGNFGGWEHYWIIRNSDQLVIDLTLQQFVADTPKLACSYPENNKDGYSWYEEFKPELGTDYLERNKAFEFYTNPHTMILPEKARQIKTYLSI